MSLHVSLLALCGPCYDTALLNPSRMRRALGSSFWMAALRPELAQARARLAFYKSETKADARGDDLATPLVVIVVHNGRLLAPRERVPALLPAQPLLGRHTPRRPRARGPRAGLATQRAHTPARLQLGRAQVEPQRACRARARAIASL